MKISDKIQNKLFSSIQFLKIVCNQFCHQSKIDQNDQIVKGGDLTEK